jgi:hypothetical protein
MSFGLMSPNMRFLVPNVMSFVRCRVRERIISACVFPTMKHGGGGVMVWGSFAGDTICDLFRIQSTLNQHDYHCFLQQYATPSGLHLVGLSFVFQRDNDPKHTSRYIRERVMECCIRWPGLHNPPTSTKLRWFGMSWTAEWRKSSQQVLMWELLQLEKHSRND